MTPEQEKLHKVLMELGAEISLAERACNTGLYTDGRKPVYSRISPWISSMKADMDQIIKIWFQEVKD